MRYIKDILLEKAILHVIDVHADEPIISTRVLDITVDVEEFVRKHVIKALNDNETSSARFLSDDVKACQRVIDVIKNQDHFYQSSVLLAKKMFNVIKNTEITSGDMLFVQFVADEQRCFGILKLDYKNSFNHNISFDHENLLINLITQTIGLPGNAQQLKKCAFFSKGLGNTIEMIVLDKNEKIEDGKENYFTENFLECVLITDDTYKTRRLKPTIEKWVQKNLSEQIELASEIRATVNELLLSEETIDPIDMILKTNATPLVVESFREAVSDAGYKSNMFNDNVFKVDKTFVEKSMKSKTLKTDTGVKIKGEYDFFKDTQRFLVKENSDGTVDYIIKGVRNVVEK